MKVKSLLQKYNLRPSKSLGQNFLHDEAIAQRIIAMAELSPGEDVLEVGPGLGILTALIATKARHVVAVEIDRYLAHILGETLSHLPNVEIVNQDVLHFDPGTILPEESNYKVISNLPYSITSAAIRHLLETDHRPQLLVLMVQREVAERILSGPGDMNLLALSVQYYGVPRLAFRVPRGAFYPVPKVDSAVVAIEPHQVLPICADKRELFFTAARAAFEQKRKQILNSLAAGLDLGKDTLQEALLRSDIDPKRRPETLSLAEWGKLCESIQELADETT